MRHALTLAIALVGPAIASVAAAQTPGEQLERGRDEFRRHDWQRATETLAALLYPQPQLGDRDAVTEAHVLLGACKLELGDERTARDEFDRALRIDADLKLSPLTFSELALKTFDDVKVELRVDFERAAAERAAILERQRLEEALKNRVFYEEHSSVVSFIPFGIGQLQNNQYKKAALFGAGELLTATTSVAIWGYLIDTYGLKGTVDPSVHDPHDVRLLQEIEIGSGAVFIGLALWGIIDARLHYKPALKVDPSQLPPELRDLGAPVARPKRSAFHVVPMLVPSGAGVGLAWEP